MTMPTMALSNCAKTSVTVTGPGKPVSADFQAVYEDLRTSVSQAWTFCKSAGEEKLKNFKSWSSDLKFPVAGPTLPGPSGPSSPTVSDAISKSTEENLEKYIFEDLVTLRRLHEERWKKTLERLNELVDGAYRQRFYRYMDMHEGMEFAEGGGSV